jgi:hypothetical protein
MWTRFIFAGAICSGAICSGMAPQAQAGELRRMSCTVVRFYVAKYSAPAAESWARSKGATDAEIEAARQCLQGMPIQTATALSTSAH